MSCIFCNSFYHLSHTCDIHVTDVSRKSRAETKKLCVECLSKTCNIKTSGFMLTKCEAVNGCSICYSKNHHSPFCPDRFTAPNFFIPNIDHDLFPRFLAMLDVVENQFVAFHSPTTFNLCKLQPLTAVNEIHPFRFEPPKDTKAVICKNIELSCYSFSSDFFYDMRDMKILVENVKFIFANISPENIYALLSTRTKSLILKSAKFSSTFIKITMDEIFIRAPNLEVFEYDTCHDNSWQLNDFFQNSFPRTLKKFKLTVLHSVDIEKIIPFIKKSSSNLKIELYFYTAVSYRYEKEFFVDKISKFFIPAKSDDTHSFLVFIEKSYCSSARYNFIGSYVLKSSFA